MAHYLENYLPKELPKPVVKKDEFIIAAIGLDHNHICGMVRNLIDAGATLKWVYDPDRQKMERFKERFPEVQFVTVEEDILIDSTVKLVVAANITSQRADLGIRVMNAGKDFFVDKAPFTTLEQLNRIQQTIQKTQQKYMVSYSERISNESAIFANILIKEKLIGKVLQVIGLGPHRLRAETRPKWFFEKAEYGGILCDIGSHQLDQFLFYTQSDDATIKQAQIANYNHPQYPEIDDFGDVNLQSTNGTTGYFRVDWFTPDGLSNWGDGRTIILGTRGYIELRKYVDITNKTRTDNVYLVNQTGEYYLNVKNKIGYPFFGELILDCIHRTEYAMTQKHALKVGELAVVAQNIAEGKIKSNGK